MDRDFTSLIRQARTIQSQVNKKSSRKKKPDTARVFANLMFEGKVSAAIRMLCDEDNRGVLELSEATKAELMKKHPPPSPIKCDSLLCGPLFQIDEIYFSKIDSEMIARSAKMTRGSAGPTETGADFFRHILTHRNFNIEGKKLREQAANFARRFETRIYNSEAIDSYVNCRLIPGVRPIGVGETFRRIIGKTIGWILKLEIQEVAGPLQTCIGLKSGAEAAVHYMQEQYRMESSEAVILVDASNAFNSVNRQALLHNLQILCPQFSKVAINMYRRSCKMFVAGTEIQSQEGTTQGDNLAMALFAPGTLSLLATLADRHREVSQVWRHLLIDIEILYVYQQVSPYLRSVSSMAC